MYEIKPLEQDNIIFIYKLMSESNNISALHTDTVSMEEWQHIFSESKNDKDEENFIVYRNNTPCGWLKLNGLQNKDAAWISMLVVSDSFKHQGVGKYAIKFTIDYLSKKDYGQIKIQTTKDNLPAISLYTKLGFKQIETKESKIIISKEIRHFSFENITRENISKYKKLRKIFAEYKIQTLRNHGEAPGSKKMFYNLFDGIIARASNSDSDYFVVMQSDKEIIGFASISTVASDIVSIPYSYGTVNDFYISPKHRRKGYGRILNEHIEQIFIDNKTDTVLLYPDPVHGIPFWKAVGYRDTGINQGWGHYLVYCKHLTENMHTAEIDKVISELVKPTDLISINPYNKPQIKEVYGVWKEYCKEANRNPHQKDVRNMAWNARKNRTVSFKALYYQGGIIGFTYKADNEINYVLPEYRDFDT